MAQRKRNKTAPTDAAPDGKITDYRHADKRKNIPPAGLAAHGKVNEVPKTRYAYDPHLPPVLRFDETGKQDALPKLLATARQRALTADEARLLADALRNNQPWLEWAGKREKRWFEVDPVALHIHERASTQAILKLAQREPLQRNLFADPELDYRQAIQFYQHDVDWANRLILGDSLVVMHSLARREDLAGKVQMIYIDPPYGINFRSNFQSQVGQRDVSDKEQDLTREPEQVKAYRDTWMLGVHSYLAYLRDRLVIARDLLADTGSIFVQISDENLHRVRAIMDEVFGAANFVCQISIQKTGSAVGSFIQTNFDFLLWYAKDYSLAESKFNRLYLQRRPGGAGGSGYSRVEEPSGARRPMVENDYNGSGTPHGDLRLWRSYPLTSDGFRETTTVNFDFQGETFHPGANRHWGVVPEELRRVGRAERITIDGNQISLVRYWEDSPVVPIGAHWGDIGGVSDRVYVVQTTTKIIERCLLMTTAPGDLVLDPTCGSGTTAYVAEQWGRRWITIDTSRVAVALARQRLLTAKFDYYPCEGSQPSQGFEYKTVPHITLKSIAQNQALDPLFAKWEPILAEKLAALNAALADVTPEIRAKLQTKFADKERREGKSSITDADRRRWVLPSPRGRGAGERAGWQEWQVPFDSGPDWPKSLRDALKDYRAAWRKKMDAVNATIAASAPQETLVDQPKVTPGILRVSGPFTVEGVQPAEESLDLESPIGGEPEELGTFPSPSQGEGVGMRVSDEPANAQAYIEKMIRLLRQDGVHFPNNKVQKFQRLDPLPHSILHAEGQWGNGEGIRRVAVSFGPQYGPITAKQVEDCLWAASHAGYDDLVFAGFTIDGAAQAVIQDDPNPKVRCHLAHIRPDVNMGNLLKDTPGSQLFTVFGLPRVSITQKKGEWIVTMEGVDIYDPVTNTIRATDADKVAAWFLDSDYDGRTFCITQAFFPDSSAWEKLARALKSVVDPERFEAFSGTHSLPFEAGEHKRIAVKVIDPRGNEVMRVMRVDRNY